MADILGRELTVEDVREILSKHGLRLSEDDENDYLSILQEMQRDVGAVYSLREYNDSRVGPFSEGAFTRPTPAQNPLNAWSHWMTTTRESHADSWELGLRESESLQGRTLAVKDSVSVAGVPLTCGTNEYHLSQDEPYPIPKIHAPVVSRLLQAGGTLVGTATCENYCVSLASFTSATGPVENPWAKGRSAGGSSSGCAALVAVDVVREWRERHGLPALELGQGVDLAIGSDQAGSIRAPAGYCGIYGLKPTHGLVPYTGIVGAHPMIDTCGPMATSINDIALLLSVLAGYDGLDPRMTAESPLRKDVPNYAGDLDTAVSKKTLAGQWTSTTAAKGLRIGVLREAFEVYAVDSQVRAVIQEAGETFAQLGAIVEEVSIPLHKLGKAIWMATNRGEMADIILANKAPDLLSHPMLHLQPPLPDQLWLDTMTRSNPAVVNTFLFGDWFSNLPQGVRAKAITHVHQLRATYDEALATYDVLLTPVSPTVAPPHADPAASAATRYYAAVGSGANTCPFNITGHPALSMPAGLATSDDGVLPVPMQLVAKRWDEATLLFAASAWETAGKGLQKNIVVA